MDDALFILPHFFASAGHDDFSEGVTAMAKWQKFLLFLLGGPQGEGRLDIRPAKAAIDNEINLVLANFPFPILACFNRHDADINRISTNPQFVEQYVFHQMCLLLLTPIQTGIAEPHIFGE